MIFLDEYLLSFFEKNQEDLKNNYPGISLTRIKSDLEILAKRFGVYSENLFKNIRSFDFYFTGLKIGTPLEYLTNTSYFYKNEFYINENVLIPRSESEILVEMVVNDINSNDKQSISLIDIGTGSGALALSIACDINKKIEITASDISEKALDVAKTNFFLLKNNMHRSQNIDFVVSDRLESVEKTFDYIVSNPPYIKRKGDFHLVHGQVHQYEPKLALYIDDEKYEKWFDLFFEQMLSKLNPNGLFIMEGHEDHLQELSTKITDTKELKIVNDYTNRKRFLYMRKA